MFPDCCAELALGNDGMYRACDRDLLPCLRSKAANPLLGISESMGRVLQASIDMHTLHIHTVIKVEDAMDEVHHRVILVVQSGEY